MAQTMVGTQAPQKLFGDFPQATSNLPGMVTPQITAAMPSYVDLEGILNAQNMQKALSHAAWARSAAINNARTAQSNVPQGHYLPSTASQTSGMGAQNMNPGTGASGVPGFQGPVLWAPRNLRGPQLGTWSEKQRQLADAAHKRPPIIMQAYADDPHDPRGGEGIPLNGGSITGAGLTTPLGGANPAILARMWNDRGGGGRTRQAQPQDVFPQQSLRERTSPGPQYQYDMWGGR